MQFRVELIASSFLYLISKQARVNAAAYGRSKRVFVFHQIIAWR